MPSNPAESLRVRKLLDLRLACWPGEEYAIVYDRASTNAYQVTRDSADALEAILTAGGKMPVADAKRVVGRNELAELMAVGLLERDR